MNIKHLEMAGAVSTLSCITIQKSFFGLCEKVIYRPTNSPINVKKLEYSANDGERLKHLLGLPISKMEEDIKAKGKPQSVSLGNYKLEVCLSQDRQFCALQLFRFVNYDYTTVTPFIALEGKEAEVASLLF